MRRFLTYTMAVLVIITFIPLGEALAKDVCVQDSQGTLWMFKAIKPLTKPYQFSPLNGIWILDGVAAPCHGQAYVESDGTVNVGLFTHFDIYGVNFSIHARGSTFDTVSGLYDNGDDGTSDGNISFVGYIDCRSIILP